MAGSCRLILFMQVLPSGTGFQSDWWITRAWATGILGRVRFTAHQRLPAASLKVSFATRLSLLSIDSCLLARSEKITTPWTPVRPEGKSILRRNLVSLTFLVGTLVIGIICGILIDKLPVFFYRYSEMAYHYSNHEAVEPSYWPWSIGFYMAMPPT